MPMLAVDFAKGGDGPVLAEVGRITALEAPHRMRDAIFPGCGTAFLDS
jgi:hypothetical protein